MVDTEYLNKFITRVKETYSKAECLNRTFSLTIGEAVKIAKVIGKLMEEQEPVEPWMSYDGKEYVFHCKNCDYEIYHNGDSRDETKAREYALFCRHCGRRVKWE